MHRPEWILVPLLAQVLLTALVWVWMYVTRFRLILARGIAPQQLATRSQHSVLADVAAPSDNLQNLFELPVLFYTGALLAYAAGTSDRLLLGLAWAYVALRWLHSLIHITYNRVMHRFTAYFLSSLVLWVFWLVLGTRIVLRLT